jgi:chloramphenicol-sensitive protein RarD
MSLPEAAPEAIAPVISPSAKPQRDSSNGVVAALLAYGAWGFLPLLFHALEHVDPVLVVAERTLWSLVLLALILALGAGFGEVRALFADGRRLVVTLVSAVLLAGNWLLYVWAVTTGQVLEASFGYFINPLINIVIGMVMLGERQNLLQSVAIGIAAVAIAIQAIGLGSVPFVALGLALTFGLYGYFRKTAALAPAAGLFAETALIAPVALGYVGFSLATQGLGPHADPVTVLVLMLCGPATALPLLLFVHAVRRLRLTTIGMFQYIAPSIQFILAIVFFGEHLNGTRLFSFALIWLSLVVFTYDSFRRRARG